MMQGGVTYDHLLPLHKRQCLVAIIFHPYIPFHFIYVIMIMIQICFFYQVCISFGLHEGKVVIPKTTKIDRVSENLKSTTLSLDETDIKRMRELNRNHRFVTGDFLFKPGETESHFWDSEEDAKFVINFNHEDSIL